MLTGDIGFVAPFGREITITLTDLGTTTDTRSGSVYEALLDGSELGLTSPTAIDASLFSTGVFQESVAAGFHDLGVWDFISTYVGFSSPYGGFVDGDFSQANVSVLVTEVPEPASVTLMAMGLISLFVMAGGRKHLRAVI